MSGIYGAGYSQKFDTTIWTKTEKQPGRWFREAKEGWANGTTRNAGSRSDRICQISPTQHQPVFP